MATKSRDRCKVVFGRRHLRAVEPSGIRGVHPHQAEGGKQRRGPKQNIRISRRPPDNEAVDELVRARVDELGGTCFATNADPDFRESRRHAGEALPVQRRERPGSMFNDRLDDTRGRLVDPEGAGGELRRYLIVNGKQ